MFLADWLRRSRNFSHNRLPGFRTPRFRPRIEALEDRCLPSNLIVNGGFETGDFTGWTLFNNEIFTRVAGSPNPPHTGNFAAQLGNVGFDADIQQTIPTVAGGIYTFSFWYLRSGGTPADLHVLWGGLDVYDEVNSAAHGYVQYTFTEAATGSSTQIDFLARDDPSFDALDDVSVNPLLVVTVTPPAPQSATAGAPNSFSLGSFTDPSSGPWTVTVDWGDSTPVQTFVPASAGTIDPESHTYAAAATYNVTETVTDTGTGQSNAGAFSVSVTSLGLGVQAGQAAGIGFWNNNNGQALITSFNNGASDTTLSTWLATNFADLYGAGAGANNLTGMTNAQVAGFYQTLFNETGPKGDAQVLAAALDVYATTSSLGGNNATQYGFTVNAYGLGASSYNVGSNGAAFGVANNTTLDVWQLLLGVNAQAVNGVLYNGNATLIADAVNVFGGIALLGGI